jgi:hypothetical protein
MIRPRWDEGKYGLLSISLTIFVGDLEDEPNKVPKL